MAITTVVVCDPGPPWVSMKNWVKARNDPITEMIKHSAMVRRSIGSVTWRSVRHQPAPSSSADSYTSLGMPCMPDISSIMVRPDTPQTTRMQITMVPRLPSTSQAVLPSVRPIHFKIRLIMPLSGWASSTIRKLSVVRPTTYGMKKTVRSILAPRRLDRTSTASV
jgi:hypothetical protein